MQLEYYREFHLLELTGCILSLLSLCLFIGYTYRNIQKY